MTTQDRQQIKAFMANPAMVAAVKSILAPDDETVEQIDKTLDDAEYGRQVKVFTEVRKLVAERFATLTRVASSNPQPAQQNEAR